MGGWHGLAELFLRLIDRYDEWAITLFVLVEEAGLPLPVPGDVAMLLAGYRVARGEISLPWNLFLIELATVLGASVLYWLDARGGRPLLHRYGRLLHCPPNRLARVEGWLARRGFVAVLLGWLIPGLRVGTPLAAGALGVPYRAFLPALALGSVVYILALVLAGLWAGPRAIEAVETIRLPLRAALTLAAFVALGGALLVTYRRAGRGGGLAPPRAAAPPGTAVLAGFLATIEMALGVNLLLYALGAVGVLRPEAALLAFLERAAAGYTGGSAPRLVLLLAGLMLTVNVLLALLYARVGIRRLPGPPWAEGLTFAAVPFLLWGLVLLPALGAGPLGLGLGAGWLPLAGEAVRNALFGVGLGVSHALLHRARARPAPAGAAPARPLPAPDGAGSR